MHKLRRDFRPLKIAEGPYAGACFGSAVGRSVAQQIAFGAYTDRRRRYRALWPFRHTIALGQTGVSRYREAHLMAQYRAPMWTWLLLVVALLLIFGRCSDGDRELSNHGQIAMLRSTGAAS